MPKGKRNSKIIWDEETIALHDLDRGTRQKIDEPDTPYTSYDASQESKEVNQGPRFSLDDDINHDNNQGNNMLRDDTLRDDMLSENVISGKTSLVRGLSEDMMVDGGAHGGVQPRSPSEDTVPPRGSSLSAGNMGLLMGKLEGVASDPNQGEVYNTPVKEDKFAAKRQNHYNEFEMLKRWREQHGDDDDDDDDVDDEEKDEGEGKRP
mmetsp:Transcript_2993/g.6076  ORF Transcript_2993/g.6076 Transcript_2993/m.6076 type:complete len:207 (+) Transcript_2993:167-787(+)